MNTFLLAVKGSTRKRTQKQMIGSQVGMGSTSTGGFTVTSYCRFKPEYLIKGFECLICLIT